jgi:POT family proton-dependent oligopeptide transporter
MYLGQQLAGDRQGRRPTGSWRSTPSTRVGELCLSPIGLSMVTKLAPARVGSLAMGLWFSGT